LIGDPEAIRRGEMALRQTPEADGKRMIESVLFTSERLLFYTVFNYALKTRWNNVKKSQRVLRIVWKN
jgi:hypothetical protein